MKVLKVIEILGQSEKSWDDAAQKIVDQASKSVKNIRSLYVKEMSANVKDNKITEFRINAKITFEVD